MDNFYEAQDGYPGYKFQSYQTSISESPDNLEDIGAPAFSGSPNTANMIPKKVYLVEVYGMMVRQLVIWIFRGLV